MRPPEPIVRYRSMPILTAARQFDSIGLARDTKIENRVVRYFFSNLSSVYNTEKVNCHDVDQCSATMPGRWCCTWDATTNGPVGLCSPQPIGPVGLLKYGVQLSGVLYQVCSHTSTLCLDIKWIVPITLRDWGSRISLTRLEIL